MYSDSDIPNSYIVEVGYETHHEQSHISHTLSHTEVTSHGPKYFRFKLCQLYLTIIPVHLHLECSMTYKVLQDVEDYPQNHIKLDCSHFSLTIKPSEHIITIIQNIINHDNSRSSPIDLKLGNHKLSLEWRLQINDGLRCKIRHIVG